MTSMRILSTVLAYALVLGLFPVEPLLARDSFVETFDGNGPYESPRGLRKGLDNPGWGFGGDGVIRDGGYAFLVAPNRDGMEVERVFRVLSDDCSFVERIEIRDAFLGITQENPFPTTVSRFALWHLIEEGPLSVLVHEPNVNPSDWELIVAAGISQFVEKVPSGTHIALEISFDKESSQATFGYDNNIDDELPAMTFGPFSAPGGSQQTFFEALAGGHGVVSGILDHWTYTSACDLQDADFNTNGTLDADDIDLLSQVVRLGTNDADYDLNMDQVVDELDRTRWVETLKRTYFGDANLDGEFNSLDLVTVFQSAQYEDGISENSGWCSGDWNGDAEFTSRDLVVAFTGGRYEQGPRRSVDAVPEPSITGLMSLVGVGWMLIRRKRRPFAS
jgi:hypothetical protein